MNDFLLEYYLWLKAFHVVAVIAWMAGLLYLPRLFVYHTETAKGSTQAATFKVMERRLLRYIMNPAMIAVWILGPLMLWAQPALLQAGWLHAKFVLVLMMTILHHVFARWRKEFEHDRNERPAKFYKIWNEAPTVLMILIVILAVVKPF